MTCRTNFLFSNYSTKHENLLHEAPQSNELGFLWPLSQLPF